MLIDLANTGDFTIFSSFDSVEKLRDILLLDCASIVFFFVLFFYGFIRRTSIGLFV